MRPKRNVMHGSRLRGTSQRTTARAYGSSSPGATSLSWGGAHPCQGAQPVPAPHLSIITGAARLEGPSQDTIGLQSTALLSHDSGHLEFKVKVSAGLGSDEASPPGLRTAALSTHTACVQTGEWSLASLPLLMRTPLLFDQGPSLMTSRSLNYPLNGPISKDSHVTG